MHPKKVDPKKMQKSLDRLFSIYKDISSTADEIMKNRCPYKNAKSRCTALFKCQNQKFVSSEDLPVCTGSDKLDYRSAWESSVN